MNNLEISQRATLLPITAVARQKLGIPPECIENFGHFKGKITRDFLEGLQGKPDGKLVLVTAVSPTPAGEGKTTTTIGLGDALNYIGKRALICLREPALGPVFGVKGGATGGGYAQVAPMEDINLHFTGDFAAIAQANNLLAALIDNHIHFGNALKFDTRRITWRRVVDINDRSLRDIVVGLGGKTNGYPREDGFDIVVGYSIEGQPILARHLKAHGAMTVLLKQALSPNLVQTLENNAALIHGGPFANIAHGCNSVIATRAALKLADYVVTEAGFGADLGAEKFLDIKCRKSGIKPSAAVIVATIRALKYHGGVAVADVGRENLPALRAGLVNLERHVDNMQSVFGLPCVVAINHRAEDTDAEVAALSQLGARKGVKVVLARHFAQGGKGAAELANEVVALCDANPTPELKFAYDDAETLWEKVCAVARKIYHAADVTADKRVRAEIQRLQDAGYGRFPVCIAKTQYSFSTDPALRGAPTGHIVNVREVRLAAGAEFVVAICGDVMTMPGLPREPAASSIDLDDNGTIVGMF
jgi:formate--tetrahydrofolate ligase